jgi:hypothetical protein
MIGTLRRHSKVLWWFVIIVIIVAFVIFFSPHQSTGGGGGGLDRGHGTVYGRTIRVDEYDRALRLARLGLRLRSSQQQIRPTREEAAREAYQIVFLQEKFRQFGIHPGDDAVAAFLSKNLVDPETGKNNYSMMIDVVEREGFTELDYIDYIRLQVGIQHLTDLVQVPAVLVTPQQAKSAFLRENEQVLLSAVVFSSSNHLSSVEVNPDGLTEFYNARLSSYRVPEKKQVAYLRFAGTNYLDQAQAELDELPELKAQMEEFYEQQGPDAFRDDDDQPMSREAAIAQILEAQVENVAVNFARREAVAFYNELAQGQADLDGFLNLAESKGLEVLETQPLGGFDFSMELSSIRNLNQILGQISRAQPFSEPLTTQEGVYILALKDVVPSRVPPLEEVQARVISEYRRSLALEAAKNDGQIFRVIATNAIVEGKNLVTIAEEQGLNALELPPITLAMNTVSGLPPQLDLNAIKNSAFALEPGQVSEFIPSRDGGLLLQLNERKPPEESSIQAALGSYLEEMRDRNRQQVFNTWFIEEFARSGLEAFIRELTSGDSEES